MKKLILLTAIFAMLPLALADVGVIAEFPNGTVYSDCVKVSDGKNVYQILQETDLDAGWSDDGMWGRALCMINGVGSEPSGDACSDWSSYWAFSLSLDTDNDWTAHSPVGFTAGSCWNRDHETPSYDGHYCAKDGDVIGLHYTDDFPSGYPEFISFEALCAKEEKTGPIEKQLLMSSRPFWKRYCEDCGITYDETLAPQTLRRLCDEKKNQTNYTTEELGLAQNDNLTGAQDSAAAVGNATKGKKINYVYKPQIIVDFSEPFRVFFNSEDYILGGLPVIVNGESYTTSPDGMISFKVDLGDYRVDICYPDFENLSVIFRIGG
jgi:hypothetical protein